MRYSNSGKNFPACQSGQQRFRQWVISSGNQATNGGIPLREDKGGRQATGTTIEVKTGDLRGGSRLSLEILGDPPGQNPSSVECLKLPDGPFAGSIGVYRQFRDRGKHRVISGGTAIRQVTHACIMTPHTRRATVATPHPAKTGEEGFRSFTNSENRA